MAPSIELSLANLNAKLRALQTEVYALNLVIRDSRTPWYAKTIGVLTIGLAVSPIDPIPDFVPVLGYVDDLLFIPLGVYLVRRSVPEALMNEAREQAVAERENSAAGWLVAATIAVLWLVALVVGIRLVQRLL